MSILAITRLRCVLGMRTLARFTKSRGSETLTTSYGSRRVGMAGAHVSYGLLLITIAYNKVIVKSAETKKLRLTIPPQVLYRADKVIR